MTDPSTERSQHEQQLDAIIAEYYEAAEQGRPPNRAEFLRQHPDFSAELREFFADVRQIEQVAPPLRPALEDTKQYDSSQGSSLSPGVLVRYVGDYEILEELGSGGMGVVYKARQAKLKKIVALKMIKMGQLASEHEVRRFQAEARAAANLDHPGIVTVHEVGVHQNHHFYAMDYVAGDSLSKLHRDEPVAARRAAELVKQLAEAMHYAHGQGIVHRDLKPANVLLTTTGVPRITDFGLAKRLWSDDESAGVTMTETGQVLGTAGYMSPEQAAGKTRLVGPSADIYALGAILYALLTGRAPFVGESQAATILQVIHNEPVSPRVLNPSISSDLETICLKCLEKEPAKRYGTAQLLADDLGRFLEGRPVLARPISLPARAWRWCRRNAVMSSLMATSALFLLVVALLTTVGYITQSRLAQELQAENARTNQNLYFVSVRLALQDVQNGDFTNARRLLERAPPEYRHWEWYWLMRLCDGYAKPVDFPDGAMPAPYDAYSPDGQLMFQAMIVSPHEAGDKFEQDEPEFRLLNVRSGQEVGRHRGVALVFAPDSRSFAITSRDGKIDLIDIASGERKRRYQLNRSNLRAFDPELNVCFSPDGRFLAVNELWSRITVWRTDSEVPCLRISLPGDPPLTWSWHELTWGKGQFFSPDGKTLAFPSASDRTVISLWNLDECSVSRELKGHTARVDSLHYSADGARLVSLDDRGVAKIWDPAAGEPVFETAVSGGIFRLSADGKSLAVAVGRAYGDGSGYQPQRVQVHDTTDGAVRWQRDLPACAVEFSRDSSLLVVVSEYENYLRVINAHSGQDLLVLPILPMGLPTGNGKGDESLFASRDDVAIYNSKTANRPVQEGAVSQEFTLASGVHIMDLSRLVFGDPDSGDPDRVSKHYTINSDGTFVWSVAPYKKPSPWGSFRSFDPDRPSSYTIQAWDFATERKILQSQVTDYLLSTDGLEFAAAHEDSTEIWSLNSRATAMPSQALRPLHTLAATGKPLAFSTTRKRLISEKVTQTVHVEATPRGGAAVWYSWRAHDRPTAKEVNVWPLDQRAPLLKFELRESKAPDRDPIFFFRPPDGPELKSNVFSVICSDDARHLVALCGNDVHLWDCETGRRNTVFNHTGPVRKAMFSPLGTYLATASKPKVGASEISLWNPASGKLLHRFAVTGTITRLQFPTGDRLLSWNSVESQGLQVQLRSVPAGELLMSDWTSHDEPVLAPDGKQFLYKLKSGDYCVIQIASGQTVTLPGSSLSHNFCFSPDCQRLVALKDGALLMYDTQSGTEVFRWSIPNSSHIAPPQFSPDGSPILVRNLRLDSGMRRAPTTKK
jgi:WD40 repeat protein/tRNA A-37 threonylcarbamoyl transferase component Bud32